MIRQTVKFAVFLLALSTIQSCTKLVCQEVSGDSPLLIIEMFPEHLDRYIYKSPNETLELVMERHTIEPKDKARYIGSCDGARYLKNCSCSSQHYEDYSNEEFSFHFYASNTHVADELPRNSIMIEAREGNGDNQINARISFEQRNLESELDRLLVTEIVLNGVTFNDVYSFSNYEESMTLIIKPHEGMVAFYLDGILYELVN